MSNVPTAELSRAARRRYVLRGLLRALIMTIALLVLYLIVPLGAVAALPLWAALSLALLALLAVTGWQTRAIVRSKRPGLRGIEALAVIAPLYLILFAGTYYLTALSEPGSFTEDALSRVDALYLTVTVFATVGFGDISPASELARVLVMLQMILNLIVLGAGIRLLTAAVHRGRESRADADEEA